MARARRDEPSPAIASASQALTKLAQEKPSLSASCDVLKEMLPALFAQSVVENPPTLEAAIGRDKLAGGIPLLRGDRVTLEGQSLHRRWGAVCAAVRRRNADAKRVADAFADLDPPALLAEVLAGRSEAVAARAEALNLDAALTATVLRLATLPVLAKFAAAKRSFSSRCQF